MYVIVVVDNEEYIGESAEIFSTVEEAQKRIDSWKVKGLSSVEYVITKKER